MRITKIEDLHCNAGWRDFSFVKISTDEGIVGWSEFMESYGSAGLAGVIRKLSEKLIGWDPRAVEKIRTVNAVAMSPDGKHVAYALSVPRIAGTDEDGAASQTSRFKDPDDGRFDVSGFLDTAYGFVPLLIPITEPAIVPAPNAAPIAAHEPAPPSSSFASTGPSASTHGSAIQW